MYTSKQSFTLMLGCIFLALCTNACASETVTTKKIAITFDDAPRGDFVLTGQERADKLIDALQRVNVEAMFFVTTRGINEKTSKRIEKYQGAGHLIGNHSDQHLWLNKVDVESYQKDFLKAHTIIKDYPNFKPYFRFPYLDEGRGREKIDAMRAFLADNDYQNAYVTVDNYDWHLDRLYYSAVKRGDTVDMQKLEKLYVDTLTDAIEYYDNLAIKYLERSPDHVLLLHENDLAANFIDELVENLRAKGWEIISPLEAFQDPISTVVTKSIFNGQGRVDAIARDMGADPKKLSHYSSDEKTLDNLFNESVIQEFIQ